ncbi:Protein-serine/threonine kinase [Dispira simplex]|nr:Protein-serine/threonine kinase [Dispira simplex]
MTELMRVCVVRCGVPSPSIGLGKPFFLHQTGHRLVQRCWYHPQFYQNRVLDPYLSRSVKTITLRQLVVFGRHVTEKRLLLSANYVRQELPVRLARRIQDFQNLPFIVGTNPYLEQVYDMYWEAFEFFRRLPSIENLEANHQFSETLQSKLYEHLVVIPKLTIGLNECAEHLAPASRDRFMNTMLRSRISRRVLAEQHISLTNHYELVHGLTERWASPERDRKAESTPFPSMYDAEQGHTLSPDSSTSVGIVHTHCNALDIIDRCSSRCRSVFAEVYQSTTTPEIVVDGSLNARFTYIPDHIEYILYELLKNAVRAVMDQVERSNRLAGSSELSSYPPIRVTICEGQVTLVFRISDQGGGIPADLLPHIWEYGQGNHNPLSNLHQVTRMAAKVNDPLCHAALLTHLGIGLPMSRVYATYWGGNVQVHTMEGFGTDVYVHVPKLGNQQEHIEIGEENDDHESVMSESTTSPTISSGDDTRDNSSYGMNRVIQQPSPSLIRINA